MTLDMNIMKIKSTLLNFLRDKITGGKFFFRKRDYMQIIFGTVLFDYRLEFIRNKAYAFFFDMGEDVSIGHNVELKLRHANRYNLCNDIKIGNHVLIARNCKIDYSGGVIIKDYVVISGETIILTHTHYPDNTTYFKVKSPVRSSSLVIEDNVFIGERATILPQVSRIGAGAIIGAGAVVTKDVPDHAKVAGNPAVIIGYTNSRRSQTNKTSV